MTDSPRRNLRAAVAPALKSLERRMFLRQSLSLGALTLLSGCNFSDDNDAADRVLWAMSRWNDKVQAALFNPNKLAPVFTESEITKPFPFNAYYAESRAPVVDGDSYRLELGGMIAEKKPWTLAELRTLPQAAQVTRHICVEGWSAIGKWSGVPFRTFLTRVDADLTARYVGFRCADDYYSSLDMATALHPQTILALDYGDAALPTKYGYPLKLRVPTKLGFKNPKHIASIFVTNDYPGGYWEDQGYNWFGGS
jgi:DMSO/TMAO reductase YedYZ molybdopterin-dependent catalytic subunit